MAQNIPDKIILVLVVFVVFILGVIIANSLLPGTPDGIGKAILTVGLSAVGIVSLIVTLVRLFQHP